MPIYVKSPKGIEEINNRSHGLPQRSRQLLILLDGKRSSSDIADLLPDGDSEKLLANLVEGGFIVLLQQPAEQPVQGKSAEKFELPKDEGQRFEMAKNFMRNTINTFLGSMGSGFISKVDKCNSLDELRLHFQAWREAMLVSGEGRKQIQDLESRLAALLS